MVQRREIKDLQGPKVNKKKKKKKKEKRKQENKEQQIPESAKGAQVQQFN